ncbi:S1 RNA-binding domain-containing protein [Candidatus Woesearchaeota archaeon]|nr:S1 RNA-binding domain-containing protein [Candidatus Woesearchaeota archaeon]
MAQKKDIPEERDLVLCTVTKIYPHCVFVNIDDYEGKQGMIHISEISPGRIRNIHDYVRMGKKVICKVLKVNIERGHIDLSLRRVSEGQKREKAELIKKDQKASKIVEFVAGKLKMDKEKLMQELVSKTQAEYATLHDFFEEYIYDESVLKKLKLQPKVYEQLSEVIKQRVKKPEVEIEGKISLKSYAADGVNVVKKILVDAQKIDEAVDIFYKGGGAYSVSVKHNNYKDAENILKKLTDFVEGAAKEADCTYEFERLEKKKKAAA